jgi:membrane carboxypeptidase/penicillin-binding protein
MDPAAAKHLSPQLVQMTVALVDPDFWQTPGADWRQWQEQRPQTLAERLVDDMLIGDEAPGLRRTLRMRLLATQLTSRFGRAQILDWYLNSANFGHQAYGAEAAAQLYLGKSASDLTLSEAVLLAVVVQAPALNPLDAPAAAIERQAQALELLGQQGIISPENLQLARLNPPVILVAEKVAETPAPAFARLALDQLVALLGPRAVERGGLRVITSLDLDLQQQAACALKIQLARLERAGGQSTAASQACQTARLLPALPLIEQALPAELNGSLVVTDPQSGEVLTLLGDSTVDKESALSMARQPGTLLAPFASAAAFARGSTPASLVWDIPASLPPELAERQNPSGQFFGPQRLRFALANDYLAALSALLVQNGPAEVWQQATLFGLPPLNAGDKPAELYYSGGAVTPLQMAQAYAVFANLGSQNGLKLPGEEAIQPVFILKAEDIFGRTRFSQLSQTQAVLSEGLAYLVHHILSDESARWPALGHPNPLEIGRPAGAKIGQTSNRRNVWAAGYTPQRMAVVALELSGPENARAPLEPKMAAGIWYAVMQYANRDLPVKDWSAPANVVSVQVCDPSGLLPKPDCPSVVSEVFLSGSEPVSADNLYKSYQINRETGKLATIYTPVTLVEQRVFMVYPPEAREWAKQSGLALPPTDYDIIQSPALSAEVQITSPALFSYVGGKVEIYGTAAGEGFKSYRLQAGKGLNPTDWVQIGAESTRPVTDDLLGEWDTQGLEGLYALRLLVIRQNQQVDSAALQITLDNVLPQAHILYPAQDQTLTPLDGSLSFQADVQDDVGLKKVEWLLDGSVDTVQQNAPFNRLVWRSRVGQHTLQIRAYDLAGNKAESEIIKFVVK